MCQLAYAVCVAPSTPDRQAILLLREYASNIGVRFDGAAVVVKGQERMHKEVRALSCTGSPVLVFCAKSRGLPYQQGIQGEEIEGGSVGKGWQ